MQVVDLDNISAVDFDWSNELSRYSPPMFIDPLIHRERLSQKLQSMRGNIIFLTGPHGIGKTSTIAAHYNALSAKGLHTKWLNISIDDNDPDILRRRLVQAWSSKSQNPSKSATHDGLLHIFIDGLDRLADPLAKQLGEELIVRAPETCCFYISSNRLHGALFHDALLRGTISVITHSDLRFSDDEAHLLLELNRSAADIARLNAFVDGWAAGLRFFAREPEIAHRFLDGNDDNAILPQEMSSYFDDVICSSLQPETLTMMSELSVINRLPIQLLHDMPNGDGAWLKLEDQIRQGIFIRYTDETKNWISFHPAFGCHIRGQLLRRSPARYDELRKFAATWFKQNRYAAEAVRHAITITEQPIAAQIIESVGAISVDLGDGPEVSLEGILTANMAIELPLLFLGQIYNLVRRGRQDEARQFFYDAKQKTKNFTELRTASEPSVISGWAHLITILFLSIDDQPITSTDIDTLETYIQQHLGTEPILAAALASVLAFVYLDRSLHTESQRIAQIGMRAQNEPNTNRVTIFLLVHEACNLIARDRIDEALTRIEEAQKLAALEGDEKCYEVVLTQIMRAILHYENNELEQAWQLIQPALSLLSNIAGWVRLYTEAYSVAAALSNILHGKEAMETVIQAGENLAFQRRLPRLSANLQVISLREYVRAGDWHSAMAQVERAPLSLYLTRENVACAQTLGDVSALLETARLMLELGRISEANDYLQRIDKAFLDKADDRSRHLYHTLAMRALYGLRRYGAAVEHLQLATDITRQSGLIRRAIEERLYTLEVYDWSKRNSWPISPANAAYIDTNLRNISIEHSQTCSEQTKPKWHANQPIQNFTLSPRESEIIALMAEGLINKEIATRLGISEGTVKTHRKKIHEKLGVSSRSQAIQRARDLLLL